MDEDDDAPPMLVAAGESDPAGDAMTAEMEDVSLTKVPITIITGWRSEDYPNVKAPTLTIIQAT